MARFTPRTRERREIRHKSSASPSPSSNRDILSVLRDFRWPSDTSPLRAARRRGYICLLDGKEIEARAMVAMAI